MKKNQIITLLVLGFLALAMISLALFYILNNPASPQDQEIDQIIEQIQTDTGTLSDNSLPELDVDDTPVVSGPASEIESEIEDLLKDLDANLDFNDFGDLE